MNEEISLDQAVHQAIVLIADVMFDEVRAPRFDTEFGGGTSFTRARDARGPNALRRIERVHADEWLGVIEDPNYFGIIQTWGGCNIRISAAGVDLRDGRRWCDPLIADGPVRDETANTYTLENRQKTPGTVDVESDRTETQSNARRIAESFTTELVLKAGGEAASYSAQWRNEFTASHEEEIGSSLEHHYGITRHPDMEPWSQVEVSDIVRRSSGHITTHFEGPFDAEVHIYDGNILEWSGRLWQLLDLFSGKDAWIETVYNGANELFRQRPVPQAMLNRLADRPNVKFSRTDKIDAVTTGLSIVGENVHLPGTPPWADEMRGKDGYGWLG